LRLHYIILLLFISSLFAYNCAIDPGFGDIPEISYLSISNDTMVQNNLNTDSVFITIAFKDGDGDLGSEDSLVPENIIVTDLRTGVVASRFNIPNLETNGLESGIEGEITIKVFTTCCIFENGIPPCSNPPDIPDNQINFEIEMIDDNGNRSNKIVTEFITLLCE